MRRAGHIASLLFLAAACGRDTSRPHGPWVRDSSGVTITFSPSPQIAELLSLDAPPILRIGVHQGDARYEFASITGVEMVRDSALLLVANAGSGELRAFDSGGRPLWSAGSPGAGPGEFREMGALVADSMGAWVFDAANDRLTRISLAGEVEVTRRFQPDLGAGSGHLAGAFADGSLAILSTTMVPSRAGFQRQTLAVARMLPEEGSLAESVIEMPGESWFGIVGEEVFTLAPIPLLARPSLAFGRGEVYTYPGFGEAILVHDTTGTLRRRLRFGTGPTSSTLDFDVYWDRVRNGLSNAERRALEAIRRDSFPASPPLFGRLIADGAGCVWAAEYSPIGSAGIWNVISTHGLWLARVRMPRGFSPQSITAHRVAGIRRDDLSVEFVEIYRRPERLSDEAGQACNALPSKAPGT